ncbi:MAG: Ig domain-containing protein [Clostridia bacterium]|nr:Ig domain-containing protein [Clostridia bacterium]
MRKKLIVVLSLLATFALSAFGMSACGGGETSSGSSSNSMESPIDSESFDGESSDDASSDDESSDDESSDDESSDDGSSDNSSSDDDSSDDELLTPSISLNKEILTVDAYTSETLTATLSNSDETIIWTSSNEEVAKVIDGKVIALGAGSATITATAGEISASCEVTVETSEAPVFTEIPDTLSIIKNKTKTLDTEMTLGGEEFSDVTYAFTVETGEGEAKVSVSEEGVISALDYGTQTVTVKAYFYGKEVASASVAVTVIEYGILITELEENKLALVIGDEGYALSNISVQLNGETLENPTLTGESKDVAIANVADGKIYGVGKGTTVVTVAYQSTIGETYTTEITVSVTKTVTEKDVNFFVQGNDERDTTPATGEAVIDLTDSGIDLSAVTKVLCNDTEVVFSVEGNTLTLTNAPAGEQTYVLETPMVEYVIEGCIYETVISTKDEFLEWRKSQGVNYQAYTVLGADIDLEGAVLEGMGDTMFYAWLDGRGHSISNFTVKQGLVGSIHRIGGVRNLQMINVVQDCSGVTGAMKYGFLTQMNGATIEDILIVGRTENLAEGVEHWGILNYGGAGSVKNVVVRLAGESEDTHYVVGPNGTDGATLDNIHFIFSGAKAAATAAGSTNSNVYATEELLDAADFSTMSSDWTVEGTKIPYMSDYSSILENVCVVVEGKPNLGTTMKLSSPSFYPVTFAVETAISGVSIDGNVVTVAEDATIDGDFTIVVTCEQYPSLRKELTYKVNKPIIHTEETYSIKGDAAFDAANTNTGNAVLNLSESAVDVSKITEIKCGDVTLDASAYTIDAENKTVTFINGAAGENEYTLVTTTANYTMNVLIYGYAISTAEEFETWRTSSTWRYTILANDIDLEGATLSSYTGWMRGVLDGRGHTIANFTVTTGITGNIYQYGGFRNIQLVNVTQDCTGIDNGVAVRNGILAQTCNGVIENVYIKGQVRNIGSGIQHWAVLCYNTGNATYARIKNVIVDVVTDGTKVHMVANSTGNIAEFDNVHFICSTAEGGTYKVTDLAVATNTGVYATEAIFLARANLSLFGAPWIVETGKLPYMSDYSSYLGTTQE